MKSEFTKKELGVIQVVLDRYNREWLPELLLMKEKVDHLGGACCVPFLK